MTTAPPPKSRVQTGAAAEALAARHLEAHGLIVLARNLRCRGGELDLVCLDGEMLVIVEVRRRTSVAFGGAPASVTLAKQRRLIHATRYFSLGRRDWRSRAMRFDVVALQGADDGCTLQWIKDAFRAT